MQKKKIVILMSVEKREIEREEKKEPKESENIMSNNVIEKKRYQNGETVIIGI